MAKVVQFYEMKKKRLWGIILNIPNILPTMMMLLFNYYNYHIIKDGFDQGDFPEIKAYFFLRIYIASKYSTESIQSWIIVSLFDVSRQALRWYKMEKVFSRQMYTNASTWGQITLTRKISLLLNHVNWTLDRIWIHIVWIWKRIRSFSIKKNTGSEQKAALDPTLIKNRIRNDPHGNPRYRSNQNKSGSESR